MNSESPIAPEAGVARSGDLASSIRRLASLYAIDGASLESCLSNMFFDSYAEVILLRDGMEIVVGGVGIRERLIALAETLHVPEPVIRPFARFSRLFPDRIGYLKMCLGPGAGPPTMHCGAMTRWSDIARFAAEEPDFAAGAPAIAALREPDSMCNLVAFTTLPAGGAPMMKVYWLLDQEEGGRSAMLAAARVAEGRIRPESKLYWMGADWSEVRTDARWNALADAAQEEFSENAFICISRLLGGGPVAEKKLYMFVQDSRVTARDQPTSMNLYYPEGLQYLYWQDFERASAAFSNAFAFEPTNAHALNNLGFCRLQMGDIHGALDDFEGAILIDPAISTANRDFALASLAGARSAGA
ncbi:MAG TPA: tetratricopeptide repeat protein [Allosphingosinicella sp.]